MNDRSKNKRHRGKALHHLTRDHHYPGAARCQKRRPVGCRTLRISEYRLGLIILLVRPQEDRPKGQKLFPGGLLWSVANVFSVPSGANTKIASALEFRMLITTLSQNYRARCSDAKR